AGERGEGERDRGVAQAAAARRFAATGGDERLLGGGERQPVPRAPQLELDERFVAPEKPAETSALGPLFRGDAQLIAQARAFGVFAPPGDQARPRRQERFVHHFDELEVVHEALLSAWPR